MLRNLDHVLGATLRATDGDIGTVDDVLVDDQRWGVRYMVVETGGWLSSRKVLIARLSLAPPDADARVLPVRISREQVRNSPDIDTDRPVSRQHELDYLSYYGYPTYWDSVGLWGAGAMPGVGVPALGIPGFEAAVGDRMAADASALPGTHRGAEPGTEPAGDPHLRSCAELIGYDIKATDHEIGHVKGFIVDDADWALRYLVVDTSRWLFGHLVLIAPQWIEQVSWGDRQVAVSLSAEDIRSAPPWNGAGLPDRSHETELYRHYRRESYWQP